MLICAGASSCGDGKGRCIHAGGGGGGGGVLWWWCFVVVVIARVSTEYLFVRLCDRHRRIKVTPCNQRCDVLIHVCLCGDGSAVTDLPSFVDGESSR